MKILNILLIVVSFASCSKNIKDNQKHLINLNTESADAWFDCRYKHYSNCKKASENTIGGKIATLSYSTFGKPLEQPPVKDAKPVQQFIDSIKTWNLDLIYKDVLLYFPDKLINIDTVKIFIVANGHPYGDAYVRPVIINGDNVSISKEKGKHVIILNALRITSLYKGTPKKQAKTVLGIVKHEIFHIIFAHYLKIAEWDNTYTTSIEELKMILLNEGIAHFVDEKDNLEKNGFPEDKAKASIHALNNALVQFNSSLIDSEELLKKANQGS